MLCKTNIWLNRITVIAVALSISIFAYVLAYGAEPRLQVLLILHKVPAPEHPLYAENKGKFDATHGNSRGWGVTGKFNDIIDYGKAPVWTKGAAEYQIYTIDRDRIDPSIEMFVKINKLAIDGHIYSGTITTDPRGWLISQGYEPPPEPEL